MEPSQSLEVEITFDVDPETCLMSNCELSMDGAMPQWVGGGLIGTDEDAGDMSQEHRVENQCQPL